MNVLNYKHSPIVLLCILLMLIGCTNQDKTLALKAEITLPSRDQEIWEREIVFFEGIASGGTPPYVYRWDFGKNRPPITLKKTGPVSFNYEGAYTVLFSVKDSKGNQNDDLVRIIVSPKS